MNKLLGTVDEGMRILQQHVGHAQQELFAGLLFDSKPPPVGDF
jgi:hypothetical protein